MATSTGRILYVSTTSGIYGFTILSNGTLSPLSSQPLANATGSYLQIAATPGIPSNQTTPLLLGATGTTATLSVWTISANGSLTSTTSLTDTNCTNKPTAFTGVAVTADDQYAFVVDGTQGSGSSVYSTATLALSGGGCTSSPIKTTSVYPVQPALDCQVAGSSNCILYLTLSTSASTGTINPTIPEQDTFTESTGTVGTPSYTPFASCGTDCPLGATFNSNSLYFYSTFIKTSSLQSIAPEVSTSTSTVSFASASLNFPCVDSIGGVAYLPTANGYLYGVSTGSGGSLGGITTLLTPATFNATLYMTSCAVVTNP